MKDQRGCSQPWFHKRFRDQHDRLGRILPEPMKVAPIDATLRPEKHRSGYRMVSIRCSMNHGWATGGRNQEYRSDCAAYNVDFSCICWWSHFTNAARYCPKFSFLNVLLWSLWFHNRVNDETYFIFTDAVSSICLTKVSRIASATTGFKRDIDTTSIAECILSIQCSVIGEYGPKSF